MDAPVPEHDIAATSDRKPVNPSRRRRQRIDAAAVTGELIASSRDVIARATQLVDRPHMVLKTLSDSGTPARQLVLCERCGLGIETPGVAIVRGRTVMHVRCDRSARAG